MPIRAEFQPFQRGEKWIVSLPPSMTPTGRRVRRVFMDKRSAETFGAKMRAAHAAGVRGTVISATLANQAAEAIRILDGTGISLIEAARMAAGKVNNAEAAETFRERYKRAIVAGECTWSDRYVLDMTRLPRWVPGWFMKMKCGAIDRPMIEKAVAEGGAKARSTKDARARYVSAILGYRERHKKADEIQILTPEETERLLDACETTAERMAVAVLVFAGIRPDAEHGEIRRLQWEDVGETIYVSRAVSKVGDRHVPIHPRLADEIKDHPKSGPVAPSNWKRTWRRIRKTASITGQDITRHTFGSNHLAAFGEKATKAAIGHTAGSSTLFRHYARAVTESEGKAFFGITETPAES